MTEQPTIASLLAGVIPLSDAAAARIAALDDGRHPTLDEMRRALGPELDLSPVAPAVLAAKVDVARAGDEELAALLDVMYRAIVSPRILRGTIDDAGLTAVREGGPLRLREGERLRLLAFADNRTEEGVEFSAETHGEGIGGWIEPHRTGSGLLDAGAMPAGTYLLPVMLVAGGRPATVDVPIECARAGTLSVRIIGANGEPCAARVYLRDDAGAAWPDGAAVERDERGDLWFHADGAFEALISGTARVRIRGTDGDAEIEVEESIPADGSVSAEARLDFG